MQGREWLVGARLRAVLTAGLGVVFAAALAFQAFRIAQSWGGAAGAPPSRRIAAQPLSEREVEVVKAVARGRSNREIADELFISVSTVKGHVSGICEKLGMRNRVEIAVWAWESGMATPVTFG
ncbi:response regulator transcription factor [Nonomuraea purpurea]|uniref:Response regulator transcription factor n=1 Tax=Nonomuraea purpurea TaxID=1849276 RepID=A0ABV8GFD3_9ACTN